eukprot:gnl/TRDRNA2_/TRDRNA2_82912_c0_seq1.p1 gnl/TRDRNA2_/TRDRNA2_82912_c0~~gnl/TRDRNA2_/TRDRNA2_82912_c0_seq1.p1  ORF type:complete len:399 (+),score=45.40 gnl/TRDRNA2_/TRDRNA2_82912_c0_seq1:60-1256(+)
MASIKASWDAYGPPRCVLPADHQAQLQCLKARPDLNGQNVEVLGWDGPSGRFMVAIPSTSERIKVKAANLRGVAHAVLTAHESWNLADRSQFFGPLPAGVARVTARFLSAGGVASLSAGSRALRAVLFLQPDAATLWEMLLVRAHGAMAAEVARIARPGVCGPALYRCSKGLRRIFRGSFEVVRGGVQEKADGFEVVACPCLRHVQWGIPTFGAQAEVRRKAGAALEEAVQALPNPLPEMSVMLVPGGPLAPRVAMTVTEPTAALHEALRKSRLEEGQNARSGARHVLAFLDELHNNLLRVVREAGHRSLVMPTLCTGGIGLPVHFVAISAVRAIHRDFCAHPSDTMRVRVACFEQSHIPSFNNIRDEVLNDFYRPDEQFEYLTSSLFSTSDDGDTGT